MASVEEKILALIRSKPPPVAANRNALVEYHQVRLEKIGVSRNADDLLPGKVIHVAGTKGKGSTCAMVESILRASGLRTGLYTSPHMVRVNERFRINGRPVSDDILEQHFEQVYRPLEEANLLPGFFSFLTLLGFHIFSRANLDVVVLEVGLGGRLDATNIIERPTVCGVTLLDLDHTEILGDTIEEIAGEKAGIFKRDVPAYVVEGQEPSALEVLKQKAGEAQCASLEVVAPLPLGTKLGLAGDYQVYNAGLAVALCKAAFPDKVTEESIERGLAECRWPGRGQRVDLNDGRVRLLLDGAHTPKSIECAVQWAKSEVLKREAERDPEDLEDGVLNVLLFNCMHTRNPVPMFESMLESGIKFDKVLFSPSEFVKPTHVKVPSAAELLVDTESDDNNQQQEKTWQEIQAEVWQALERRKERTDRAQVHTFGALEGAVVELEELRVSGERMNVFVTGSLLLVGDLMKQMNLEVC